MVHSINNSQQNYQGIRPNGSIKKKGPINTVLIPSQKSWYKNKTAIAAIAAIGLGAIASVLVAYRNSTSLIISSVFTGENKNFHKYFSQRLKNAQIVSERDFSKQSVTDSSPSSNEQTVSVIDDFKLDDSEQPLTGNNQVLQLFNNLSNSLGAVWQKQKEEKVCPAMMAWEDHIKQSITSQAQTSKSNEWVSQLVNSSAYPVCEGENKNFDKYFRQCSENDQSVRNFSEAWEDHIDQSTTRQTQTFNNNNWISKLTNYSTFFVTAITWISSLFILNYKYKNMAKQSQDASKKSQDDRNNKIKKIVKNFCDKYISDLLDSSQNIHGNKELMFAHGASKKHAIIQQVEPQTTDLELEIQDILSLTETKINAANKNQKNVIDTLKYKYSRKKQNCKNLEEDKKDISKNLDKKNKQNAEMRKQVEKATAETLRLKTKIQDKKRAISNLQEINAAYEKEIEKLKEDTTKKIEEKDKKIEEFRKFIDKLREENSIFNQERQNVIKYLEKEINILKNEKSELTEENQKKIEDLTKVIHDFEQVINKHQEKLVEQKNTFEKSLEIETNKFQKQNQILMHKIQQKELKIALFERTISSANKKIAELQSGTQQEITEKDMKIKILEEFINDYNNSIVTLQKNIEQEKEKAQVEHDNFQIETEKGFQHFISLITQLRGAQRQAVADAEKKIQDLEKKLLSKSIQNAFLSKKNDELIEKHQLDSKEKGSKIEEFQKLIDQLRVDLFKNQDLSKIFEQKILLLEKEKSEMNLISSQKMLEIEKSISSQKEIYDALEREKTEEIQSLKLQIIDLSKKINVLVEKKSLIGKLLEYGIDKFQVIFVELLEEDKTKNDQMLAQKIQQKELEMDFLKKDISDMNKELKTLTTGDQQKIVEEEIDALKESIKKSLETASVLKNEIDLLYIERSELENKHQDIIKSLQKPTQELQVDYNECQKEVDELVRQFISLINQSRKELTHQNDELTKELDDFTNRLINKTNQNADLIKEIENFKGKLLGMTVQNDELVKENKVLRKENYQLHEKFYLDDIDQKEWHENIVNRLGQAIQPELEEQQENQSFDESYNSQLVDGSFDKKSLQEISQRLIYDELNQNTENQSVLGSIQTLELDNNFDKKSLQEISQNLQNIVHTKIKQNIQNIVHTKIKQNIQNYSDLQTLKEFLLQNNFNDLYQRMEIEFRTLPVSTYLEEDIGKILLVLPTMKEEVRNNLATKISKLTNTLASNKNKVDEIDRYRLDILMDIKSQMDGKISSNEKYIELNEKYIELIDKHRGERDDLVMEMERLTSEHLDFMITFLSSPEYLNVLAKKYEK